MAKMWRWRSRCAAISVPAALLEEPAPQDCGSGVVHADLVARNPEVAEIRLHGALGVAQRDVSDWREGEGYFEDSAVRQIHVLHADGQNRGSAILKLRLVRAG